MKKLLLLFFLSVCSVPIFAQTTQELLMSTNWEPQNFVSEEDRCYIKYTASQEIFVSDIDNEIEHDPDDYYLSFSPDSVFDKNKVGKSTNGRYIIRTDGIYVYISEILELTPTKLKLKNLTPGFTTTGQVTTYLPTDMNF